MQPPELSRPLPLDRLGNQPFEVVVTTTPAERGRVAERLAIPAVGELQARFVLRRRAAGTIDAEAALTARVTQECVVTLEPVEQTIDQRFEVRFVPGIADPDETIDPDAIDEIAYEGEEIDLGEATVEQLALSLDPFPRTPGAGLPPELSAGPAEGDDAPATATVHPFAALRARRGPT